MNLTLGLLTYNDQKYLVRCCETLMAQERIGIMGKDWQIVIRDNGSQDVTYLQEVRQRFPGITILFTGENAGFGRGHNDIMRHFPALYHAVLNNDVLYEPDFFSRLVQALNTNPRYGSAVGKLLWWNYGGDPEKTDVIDTVGIGVTLSHHFRDIGQGEKDTGQYDAPAERFGGSGAAVVYRRSDLLHVMYRNGEFYDETMFMYKEDCDLSERLVAVGKPCIYIPDARAWHDRTASSRITRSMRSARERAGSAAHQTWIIRKHRHWLPLSVRIRTRIREFFRWTFLLAREPRIFLTARRLLKEGEVLAQKRREQTKHTVSFDVVSIYFSH